MRWDELFDDLEAQFAEAQRVELDAEVGERVRAERSRGLLVDRLRAASGQRVRLDVQGDDGVSGILQRVGPDWLLIADDGAGESLVPLAAVLAVSGLGPRTAEQPLAAAGRVEAGLGLAHALRGLARDRAGIALVLVDGRRLAGTLDRVGADYCELAEHPGGEPRRPGSVRAVRAVPFTAIAVCRRG
jgi:hypothetical protein